MSYKGGRVGALPPEGKEKRRQKVLEKLQSILKRLPPEISKVIFHNEKVFHVQACRMSKLRTSIVSEAEFKLKFLLVGELCFMLHDGKFSWLSTQFPRLCFDRAHEQQ